MFELESLLMTAFITLGYLLGTVPTGLLVARAKGVDIRRSGSGNIGATNVLRSVGPIAAGVVLLVDPLKGVIAVGLPALLGLDPWIVSATAIATVVGNTFNIFLGFRGGKGIATSLGVFLVLDPFVTFLAVVLFAITVMLSRFVSLGSLIAVTAGPLMLLARLDVDPNVLGVAPRLTTAFVIAALAYFSHRDNIVRLRRGTEHRFGERRGSDGSGDRGGAGSDGGSDRGSASSDRSSDRGSAGSDGGSDRGSAGDVSLPPPA